MTSNRSASARKFRRDGAHQAQPRPTRRRQSTRHAVIAAAIREG